MKIQKNRGSQFAFLNGFLHRDELDTLLSDVLRREGEFRRARIGRSGLLNTKVRRSRELLDLGKHRELISRRLLECLPSVLAMLKIRPFRGARVVVQVAASNDGDFFKQHIDHPLRERKLVSFVYYFYREPKSFTGGELVIYRTRLKGRRRIAINMSNFDTIAPQQNLIVFFPGYVFHEVLPVHCPSGRFARSRFTVNGWISA
jgi:SM-20-related protein